MGLNLKEQKDEHYVKSIIQSSSGIKVAFKAEFIFVHKSFFQCYLHIDLTIFTGT